MKIFVVHFLTINNSNYFFTDKVYKSLLSKNIYYRNTNHRNVVITNDVCLSATSLKGEKKGERKEQKTV